MSGGSVPSASTASEGEPEILPAEVQGLGQLEATPTQEEYTEEDYDEVRAARKKANGAEGRPGSVLLILCVFKRQLCDWGHTSYGLSNNEILKGFLRQFCRVQYRAVVLRVPGKEVPG